MKSEIIYLIGSIILFVLLGSLINNETDYQIKEVSCYDEHNNVIKGLTCYETKKTKNNLHYCFLLSILNLIISLIFFLKEVNDYYKENN